MQKKRRTSKEIKDILNNRTFYELRSILGNSNWANIYAIIGGRQTGKSYSVFDFCCKQFFKTKSPFIWLRLTEPSIKDMLNNNAFDFGDPDLKKKYNLNLKVKGFNIFNINENGKEELFCRTRALSTFYNDKGKGFFDKDFEGSYIIVLDEMNKEVGERTIVRDIPYAFVNQIENFIRNSSGPKVKVFLLGNTLSEASDLMSMFNFMPEKFGRFKVKKKRLVVDYLENSKAYNEMRKKALANILAENESTFSNKVDFDLKLITKEKLIYPNSIIKFSNNKKDWFTVWNDNIINFYNYEKKDYVYAMRPYLIDCTYDVEKVTKVFSFYDNRYFKFHTLFCQREFKRQLEMLKKR